MKLFFLFILINLYSFSQQECDILILRNGEEIETIVNEIGTETIKYHLCNNKSGPTYVIEKNDVFLIKYKNGQKDVFKKTNENNSINTSYIQVYDECVIIYYKDTRFEGIITKIGSSFFDYYLCNDSVSKSSHSAKMSNVSKIETLKGKVLYVRRW